MAIFRPTQFIVTFTTVAAIMYYLHGPVHNYIVPKFSQPWTDSRRRVLLIVNPYSGHETSQKYLSSLVRPMFASARIPIEIIYTKSAEHVLVISLEINIQKYEAIVVMSGDSTLSEFINGLSVRKEDFFEILENMPFGLIPCGSSNGLIANLNTNIFETTKNIIDSILENRSMKIDLFSVQHANPEFFKENPVILYDFLLITYGGAAQIDAHIEETFRSIPFYAVRELIGSLYGLLFESHDRKVEQIKYKDENDKWQVYDETIIGFFLGSPKRLSQGTCFHPTATLNNGLLYTVFMKNSNILDLLTTMIGITDKACSLVSDHGPSFDRLYMKELIFIAKEDFCRICGLPFNLGLKDEDPCEVHVKVLPHAMRLLG